MAIDRVEVYINPETGIPDVLNVGRIAAYTIVFLDRKRQLLDLLNPLATLAVEAKNDATVPDSFNFTLVADPDQMLDGNRGVALLTMPAGELTLAKVGVVNLDILINGSVRAWLKITLEPSVAA